MSSAPRVAFASLLLVTACSSAASDGKDDAVKGGDAGAGGNSGAGAGGNSGAGGAGGPGAGGVPPAATFSMCEPEEKVGAFSVQLVAETDASVAFTQVDGRVRNGVDPREIWVEEESEGDCAILTGPALSCGVPCTGGQVCGGADLCIDPPVSIPVGGASLTGLLGPVSMSPNGQAYYYFAATGPNALPFPPVAPGDPVTLQVAGAGDVAAFQIAAEGIAPIEIKSAEPIISPGQPVTVAWTAPATPSPATRVAILLDLAHHGGIAARLVCDVPDLGSATLSASMLGKLVARGTAGFPTMGVVRRSVGSSTTSKGCVELSLSSSVEVSVSVAGVDSCQEDADCTGGRTCLPDYTCG